MEAPGARPTGGCRPGLGSTARELQTRARTRRRRKLPEGAPSGRASKSTGVERNSRQVGRLVRLALAVLLQVAVASNLLGLRPPPAAAQTAGPGAHLPPLAPTGVPRRDLGSAGRRTQNGEFLTGRNELKMAARRVKLAAAASGPI